MVKKDDTQVIGYTTGVFDLFHIGHLNILERAKQECDFLVVGVTTDDLVLARKKKNPVVPFIERKRIVGALRCVDHVVSQDTMNKVDAWKSVRFNRMFVGDDWRGTDVWNEIELEFDKVGVEVVYFPYTNTTSSTLIRKVLMDMCNHESEHKLIKDVTIFSKFKSFLGRIFL